MSEPTRSPLFDPDRPYFSFNREERHLAAVLFHLLCVDGNAARLIQALRPGWLTLPDELGVYFEYSYLRDAWDAIGRKPSANEKKRDALLSMLRSFGGSPELIASLGRLSVPEFNACFVRQASTTYIQSPATWQVSTFAAEGTRFSREDLLVICRLKWAVRAKPDLVVQPSIGRALCLELKLESGEASYPATGSEIRLLRERGLYDASLPDRLPIWQTELQRLAMEHLLGEGNVAAIFITRSGPKSEQADHLSWSSLLGNLEIPPHLPRFAREAIRQCSLEVEAVAISPSEVGCL